MGKDWLASMPRLLLPSRLFSSSLSERETAGDGLGDYFSSFSLNIFDRLHLFGMWYNRRIFVHLVSFWRAVAFSVSACQHRRQP